MSDTFTRVKIIQDKLDTKKKEVDRLERLLEQTKNDKTIDLDKLLGDEAYRIKIALFMSDSKIKAAQILGMNERTFYRRLKQHKL